MERRRKASKLVCRRRRVGSSACPGSLRFERELARALLALRAVSALLWIGCANRTAEGASDSGIDAPRDAAVDLSADLAAPCMRDDVGQCVCLPNAQGFQAVAYHPTERVPGSCSTAEANAFAAACAETPNAGSCGAWLGAHAVCGQCLLGERLQGPFRRDADDQLEISPGACGQAQAGETFDAGADADVGGCGQTMENVGACIAYACAGCDGGEGCRTVAYGGDCATPGVTACGAVGAGACVLGSPEMRAAVIALAVCGADGGED